MVFFFNFKKFIFITYFWPRRVFIFTHRLSLVAVHRPLIVMTSLAVEHGL